MVQIFYFSGTGNSLSVARNLSKEIDQSEVIPMVRWLNMSNHPQLSKKVVLVFPTYLMSIPLPVREFIAKVNFSSVDYVAAVFTAENKGNLSYVSIDRLLHKYNRKLDYYCELQMPQNTPTGINPSPGDANWTKKIVADAVEKQLENSQQQCKVIASDVRKSQKHDIHISIGKQLLEKLISAMTKNNKTILPFYADETCSGCTVCEKVCPTKRISVVEKRVTWDRSIKCYYCFACFNTCPEQAILLRNYAKKDGRYINPEIKVSDLVAQREA